MNTQSQKFKVRLGLFVTGGIVLFIIAIFLIGRQKNLFDPVINVSTTFYNVSGLQVGNNVRFSGINIGTVDEIHIINDSTVKVNMLIEKDVKRFIKTDCEVSIGSVGLIGDRLVMISQGSSEAKPIKDGGYLYSAEPVETDAILASIQVTAANVQIISEQLAEVMVKINGGKGTLGRLIQDTNIAENLNQIVVNLKSSSKGLNDNMEAAKHNFLLKGYFNKKAKAKEKAKQDAMDKKEKK